MQKKLSKIIIALIAISCVFFFFNRMNNTDQKVPESTSQEAEYSNKLPEDFHDFYNSFHSDSIFQMEHIIFPLAGIGKSGDSVNTIVKKQWLADEWLLHKPFNDQGGTFERSFTNVQGIVTETITGNGGMFSMEKRYSRLADDWYLIYYQELIMHG